MQRSLSEKTPPAHGRPVAIESVKADIAHLLSEVGEILQMRQKRTRKEGRARGKPPPIEEPESSETGEDSWETDTDATSDTKSRQMDGTVLKIHSTSTSSSTLSGENPPRPLEFGRTFVKVKVDKSTDLQLSKQETHPHKMDGSCRLKQHDNVHKQIAAFEKLLQHAMSKFSKDKLYQMLKAALKGLPDLRVPRAMHSQSMASARISSIGDLRDIADAIKSRKQRGLQKEEQTHIQRYLESFFDDLVYLKDLKRYFDEKIYQCLYEYFYDPADEVDIGQYGIVPTEDKDSGNSSLDASDEDVRHQRAGPDQAELDNTYFDFDNLDDRERLSYAVKSLYQVNQKWDQLFSEEELDLDCFDPDSRYEMLSFTDLESIEPVLRLVPDLFVKSYKSIELAKLWWTQANKVCEVLPARKNSTREFNKRTQELEAQIAGLKEDIQNEEELLTVKRNDMENLKRREVKYSELSENFQQVEERKNDVGQKYNETFMEREVLLGKLKSLKKGTNAYRRVEERVSESAHKLVQTQGDLKLLSYHLGILKEDFNLEMSFRSDVIRFVADVTQKIEGLEESLELKREQKRAAQKKLVLLRTNCERMREIMRKYISSGESSRGRVTSEEEGEEEEEVANSSASGEDVEQFEEPAQYEEPVAELPTRDVNRQSRRPDHHQRPSYHSKADASYPRSPAQYEEVPTRDVNRQPRRPDHPQRPSYHSKADASYPRSHEPHQSYLAEAIDNGMILLDETIDEDIGNDGDTDTPSPKRSKPKNRTGAKVSNSRPSYKDEFQLRYEFTDPKRLERNNRREKASQNKGKSRIPMSRGQRKDPEY